MIILKGYVRHPNVGGCLIMDLGCEQTNYEKVYAYLKGTVRKLETNRLDYHTGERRNTLCYWKAKSIIKDRLNEVNNVKKRAFSNCKPYSRN